jgi:murein DD-endopeptidase MepM/ murein hydrolase activator NlpD
MLFPLTFRPSESYHERPRSFAAPRDGGQRSHAGCDLYAPIGTPVRAVADGVVLNFYLFYKDTWALEVDHFEFLVRYGEIQKNLASGIRVGMQVQAGQTLGKVGQLTGLDVSMLHFEMYDGTATGPLTDRNRPPFQRRRDLIDPTRRLDEAELTSGAGSGAVMTGLAVGAVAGAVAGAVVGAAVTGGNGPSKRGQG